MKTNPLSEGALAMQRLVEVCSDGVKGYRRAAEAASDPQLRALLERIEVEREEIASVFTCAGVELGIKSDHSGTLGGAAHRGILATAGILHADGTIVHECIRGDRLTLSAFAEALSHQLPDEMRGRVNEQIQRVGSALDRLAAFDSAKHAEVG